MEFVGVALLIRGLSNTRRSFDPHWPGIPSWLWKRLGTAVEHLGSMSQELWQRLRRKSRRLDETGLTVETASGVDVAEDVTFKLTPDWEQLEPMEAIQRVYEILYDERDRLLRRIRDSEHERQQLIAQEASARTEGDDAVRADVLQLALGGLAQEAWATVLILVGIAVTTLAGVCSVV